MRITRIQALILGAMSAACVMVGFTNDGYLANVCLIYGSFTFGAGAIASLID